MFGKNHNHSHNGAASCKYSHPIKSVEELSVGFETEDDSNSESIVTTKPGSVNEITDQLMEEKQGELVRIQLAMAKKKEKEQERAIILEEIEKKNFSRLNAVRAAQYGVLERLQELVESGQCDPNKPDKENVYLLHWAAYNNRLDIAQYLLSLGSNINQIGGELGIIVLNKLGMNNSL